jgi:hypothetical protein
MIKNHCLLLSTLIFFSFSTFAQTDYRPGCIIMLNHDTIRGEINYRDDIRNTERCTFRSDSSEVKDFAPFSIEGYMFRDGKFYVSRHIRIGNLVYPAFVQYLVKGRKSLYYFRNDSASIFLVDYQGDTVMAVPSDREVIYHDNRAYFTENTRHKGFLKVYFADCPELAKDIDAIESPDIRNMVNLTKEYHKLTCGDSGCLVYYRKPSGFRMGVEGRFGYSKVTGADAMVPIYGGLLHFWIPNRNERMFLVTGFLYSQYHKTFSDHPQDQATYSIGKVPLIFEYLFPFKVFVPKIQGGFYFNYSSSDTEKALMLTIPFSAGFMIRPVKSLAFDFSAEAEFFPAVISYSFNFGIRFFH